MIKNIQDQIYKQYIQIYQVIPTAVQKQMNKNL